MATECFCLKIDQLQQSEKELNEVIKFENDTKIKKVIELGEYAVEWRRQQVVEKDKEILFMESKVKFPSINVDVSFPILIEPIEFPSHGFVDKPNTIVYKIINKISTNILDIECTLTENEQFSISGNKLVTFSF
jgi:hypothetical protein